MKNILLVIALTFASLSQAATTKVPATMVSGLPRIAGESFFAGTASCSWSRTSTTVGAFTSSATCPGPTVVYSSLGSWQTTDSDLPRQTINSLPAGIYKAKFYASSAMGTANASAFAINDGTTTCEPVRANDAATNAGGAVVECTFVYASSGNRVFELYGGSAATALTIGNNQTAPRISTKFILEYWGNY